MFGCAFHGPFVGAAEVRLVRGVVGADRQRSGRQEGQALGRAVGGEGGARRRMTSHRSARWLRRRRCWRTPPRCTASAIRPIRNFRIAEPPRSPAEMVDRRRPGPSAEPSTAPLLPRFPAEVARREDQPATPQSAITSRSVHSNGERMDQADRRVRPRPCSGTRRASRRRSASRGRRSPTNRSNAGVRRRSG